MNEVIDILKEIQRLLEVKHFSIKCEFAPADFLRVSLGDKLIIVMSITDDGHVRMRHLSGFSCRIMVSPEKEYDFVSLCDPHSFDEIVRIVSRRVSEGVQTGW